MKQLVEKLKLYKEGILAVSVILGTIMYLASSLYFDEHYVTKENHIKILKSLKDLHNKIEVKEPTIVKYTKDHTEVSQDLKYIKESIKEMKDDIKTLRNKL